MLEKNIGYPDWNVETSHSRSVCSKHIRILFTFRLSLFEILVAWLKTWDRVSNSSNIFAYCLSIRVWMMQNMSPDVERCSTFFLELKYFSLSHRHFHPVRSSVVWNYNFTIILSRTTAGNKHLWCFWESLLQSRLHEIFSPFFCRISRWYVIIFPFSSMLVY